MLPRGSAGTPVRTPSVSKHPLMMQACLFEPAVSRGCSVAARVCLLTYLPCPSTTRVTCLSVHPPGVSTNLGPRRQSFQHVCWILVWPYGERGHVCRHACHAPCRCITARRCLCVGLPCPRTTTTWQTGTPVQPCHVRAPPPGSMAVHTPAVPQSRCTGVHAGLFAGLPSSGTMAWWQGMLVSTVLFPSATNEKVQACYMPTCHIPVLLCGAWACLFSLAMSQPRAAEA